MLPRSIMGFVLRATGWHQAGLAALSAAVFLLSAVPLEIQRRIVNDLTERGVFNNVLLLALGYAGVAIADQILKTLLNIYRGWVAESTVRSLRRAILEHKNFDLVMWLTGAGVLPFLEDGAAVSSESWDQMVRAYMQTYPDINIRMTHCANNYGPFQLPEKLIPLAVTNVLRGKKVPVYGDGLQSRDWLHVADHCAAVHRVLHAELDPIPVAAATDPGLLPIFDISARCEVANIDIVAMVVTALGLNPDEWIEHIPDRPNHDRRYLINPDKIESQLGWAPTHDFAAGIAETVAWYVEHRSWWEQIIADKGELGFDWSQVGPAATSR